MPDLPFITVDGDVRCLRGAEVGALRERLLGELLAPQDAGYDDARHIWNGMIERRPALVARCAATADVEAAMAFARTHGMAISVRGGGHNIAGTALCDGGLTIDLSRMRAVEVDAAHRVVRVEPGCTWADVDAETQSRGLVVPSGIVSTTGVSGLTLGGGFGWLTRKLGLTCDSLRAAAVLCADGRALRASAGEDADLFWALRGGSGNFGVVTSFEFEAHPVGPIVLAGMLVWPLERARDVIAAFRQLASEDHDDLGLLLMLRRAPPVPFLPEAVHGRPVIAIALCWGGELDAGERAIRPARQVPGALADVVQAKPFLQHQRMLDAAQPPGRRYYWKSEYLRGAPAEADDVLIDHASRITSPHSAILVMQLGGAAARVEADATAVAHRDAAFVANVMGSWEAAASDEDPHHIAWARSACEHLRPFATGGVYVNFLTGDEGEARVRAAYGFHYERLAALKREYDPHNVFRSNQNVRPA